MYPPAVYLLPPGKTMADVRRMDEELLASEGVLLFPDTTDQEGNMRKVSIGCGVGETLATELRRMADELESDAKEGRMQVEGNGSDQPDLELVFTDEADSDWTTPVVDYS